MRETYYNFDEQKFREYSQKRYKSAQRWKKLNAISMALVILGILFVFMPVILVGNSEFLVKAILFGAGLLCSVVPFCVAYIVRSKATRKYGKPYEESKRYFYIQMTLESSSVIMTSMIEMNLRASMYIKLRTATL